LKRIKVNTRSRYVRPGRGIVQTRQLLTSLSQLTFVIASLKDDPDNAELVALKEELDQAVQLIEESIAELRPKPSSKEAPPPAAAAPAAPEKWSRENHPAFKKAEPAAPAPAAAEEKEDPVAVAYQVNDTVLAKWVSGDKGFYAARITSVTGSSAARVYTVKFKSYDTVETLRARDIRPIGQKRKADGTLVSGGGPASSAGTAAPPAAGAGALAAPAGNGVVMTAAASLYPHAQQQREEEAAAAAAGEAPPKKFKKIKAKKELEAGKSNWQDFNNKSKFGKNKNNKKDSMFRTPEGIHGRGMCFPRPPGRPAHRV